MARALSVYLGATAAQTIAREGWSAELFSLLLGASGGPKWFVLSQLDRLLFGDFLQRSERPLSALGSSIGSWRHACLTQSDPAAAVTRLERGYLYQHYDRRPNATEVSAKSREILADVLGANGASALVNHPRIHSHIVTARGRGAAAATSTPILATAMAAAALGNSVNRNLLKLGFQRVVFHSGQNQQALLSLDDFHTCYTPLAPASVTAALHASGAIPFVLTGERDIPGAPAGRYWDGGIIDYHFDLAQYRGNGLMLYPHFGPDIIRGWFDKFLPWRASAIHAIDKLALLCPSREFIASLPHGKIPDRSDFTRMQPEQRIAYWEECVRRSAALAEEFNELITGGDPLRGATVFS